MSIYGVANSYLNLQQGPALGPDEIIWSAWTEEQAQPKVRPTEGEAPHQEETNQRRRAARSPNIQVKTHRMKMVLKCYFGIMVAKGKEGC